MEERDSMQRMSVSVELPVYRENLWSTEERSSNNRSVGNNDSEPICLRLRRYAHTVFKWHIKQYPNSRALIIFRGISIILFLVLLIIDTVAYAAPSNPPPIAFQFTWAAKYPLYDIATIIYCSGASVFGVSFEIYPFVLLAIVNVILESKNCGDLYPTVLSLVRIICLVVAVELAHWNFRRISDDVQPRKKSSRVMLHQSLLFSFSILYVASPGLRLVYDATLHKCEFQYFACGLINMNAPAFDPHAPCDPSFIEYASSREELRILRDWLILNIAFYAIFNRALFDLGNLKNARTWWFLMRLILLILFLALCTSFLVVNISPFELYKAKIAFDVIECVLSICSVSLMIFNLIRTRDENNEVLQVDPHILPRL